MAKKLLSMLLVTALIISTFSLMASAKPAANATPTSDFPEVFLDFEDAKFTSGFDITTAGSANNPFRSNWTPEHIAGDLKSQIVVDGSNKYLVVHSFFEATFDYTIEGGYIYEADYKGPTNAPTHGSLWVRGATERLPYKQFFLWYYEEGPQGVCGGTGIVFWASGANECKIGIKYRDGDSVANEIFTFTTEENFSTGFQNVKFADTGDRVNIYLNDKLLLSIELSNKGTHTGLNNQYYKTAVVKDANGTVLKTVNNALVAYAGELAFATRATTIWLDNIKVAKYNAAEDPGIPVNPETSDKGISYFAVITVLALAGVVVLKKRKVSVQ